MKKILVCLFLLIAFIVLVAVIHQISKKEDSSSVESVPPPAREMGNGQWPTLESPSDKSSVELINQIAAIDPTYERESCERSHREYLEWKRKKYLRVKGMLSSQVSLEFECTDFYGKKLIYLTDEDEIKILEMVLREAEYREASSETDLDLMPDSFSLYLVLKDQEKNQANIEVWKEGIIVDQEPFKINDRHRKIFRKVIERCVDRILNY